MEEGSASNLVITVFPALSHPPNTDLNEHSKFWKCLEKPGLSCACPCRWDKLSSGCRLGSVPALSGLSHSERSSNVSLGIIKIIIEVSGPKETSKDLWVSNLRVKWTNVSMLCAKRRDSSAAKHSDHL